MVKHNLDNHFQAVNAKTRRGTPPTNNHDHPQVTSTDLTPIVLATIRQ